MRHLLPGIAGPLAVQATFGIGGIIVAEAALSFLGLGVLPPHAELGQHARCGPRVSARRAASDDRAGVAIGSSVLGFNLLGDGLAQTIDRRG